MRPLLALILAACATSAPEPSPLIDGGLTLKDGAQIDEAPLDPPAPMGCDRVFWPPRPCRSWDPRRDVPYPQP